ncbi:MAG: metal ABC transporter substrate-binding protein [Clostridium sp.]
MNNKRIRRPGAGAITIAVALSALLFLTCLFAVGCTSAQKNGTAEEGDGKLNVVTTLFPYYDFLRQIAGDQIHLTMVVPAGMDSHSFEPTPEDVITIQNADLVICNGGEMEQWFTRVLKSLGDEGTVPGRVVTMMDYVDTVEEVVVEGMEAHEHDHGAEGHDHGAEGHDHEAEEHASGDDGREVEIEYDEHIWTSPVNAIKLVGILTHVLEEEDPANSETYRNNGETYTGRLKELDAEIRDIVKSGKRNLLIFGDKFPLRYFFDEYGLKYRAAFSGCSSDTEPSAQTIAYLIDKVRTEQIPVIYYLELSSHRVAGIIGEETGAEPLLFHSCHNVTRREFDSGVTYLELMEQNTVNLRKGLN